MVEKAEVKAESLLNLDDLLQCPVCYEIPSGQIFQCNEGHHVCGRCKMRLDVCPVCRALFFGTRNYAMEELIANFRKLRTLKSGGVATTGSSESSTPAKDKNSEEPENEINDDVEENEVVPPEQPPARTPLSSKGLFRCLCCKNGNSERLPAARILNHLRYYHRPDLLEGRTENGEYLQAWQISTTPGRLVTAIRIVNMGIFFLTIEISSDSVFAWLSMAATPWVAHTFNYSITVCGNDREAIFSDCVWSVRSCEGSLKKRGHCLLVKDLDAQALTAPASISTKLCIRRTSDDQLANQSQPRAVLRIANRVNNESLSQDFLQDFGDNVTRLTRSLATLSREANALAVIENEINQSPANARNEEQAQPTQNNANGNEIHPTMSRNARRRIRQRLRAALNGPAGEPVATPPLRHQERIHDIERRMQEIQNVFGLGDIFRNMAAQSPRSDLVAPPHARPSPFVRSGIVPPPPARSGIIPPPSARSGIIPPPSARSGIIPPPSARSGIIPPPPARSGIIPPPSARSGIIPPPPARSAIIPPPPARSGVIPPPSAHSGITPRPSARSDIIPTPPAREQHMSTLGSLLVDPRNSPAVSGPVSSSAPSPAPPGTSNGQVENGNGTRTQKKKRRHRI